MSELAMKTRELRGTVDAPCSRDAQPCERDSKRKIARPKKKVSSCETKLEYSVGLMIANRINSPRPRGHAGIPFAWYLVKRPRAARVQTGETKKEKEVGRKIKRERDYRASLLSHYARISIFRPLLGFPRTGRARSSRTTWPACRPRVCESRYLIDSSRELSPSEYKRVKTVPGTDNNRRIVRPARLFISL